MSRTHRLLATLAVCATGWAIPAAAHAADDATYTVRAGDSIYGIAAKFDVRVSALTAANDLQITSVILPGQQLTIPGGVAVPTPSTPARSASTGSVSTASASAASYTVQRGDSLYAIAARHGVSLASLLSANGFTVSSLILPGMQVKLPATASAPATSPSPATAPASPSPKASGATYKVVGGDSLYGIARRHGVSLSSLLSINGMSVTSLILPGMSLKLPAGASAPAAQPTAAPSAPTDTGASSSVSSSVAEVVRYALAQQGKPYRFFTRGPSSFDCSGLTKAAYAQIGIDLVHYSAAQARQGRAVDVENEPIRAGDLIFMKRRGSDTINHVGMAIDANRWIHAVGTGDVVRIGSMPAIGSIEAVRRYVDS